MKEVLLPSKVETTILATIKRNVPVLITPEEIRNDQMEAEKDFTLDLWKRLKLKYSEKELVKYFFFGNITGYMIYKSDAEDRIKMQEHVKNGIDPHHINMEQLDDFYATDIEGRRYTATDHQSVYENNQCKLGDKKLQLKLESILFNTFGHYQFSADAIKGLAEEHGLPLTLQDCKKKADEVNKVLRDMAFMSARKSGLANMEEEFLKFLNMYSKKENLSPELTNALALRGKKTIRLMQSNLARNVATSMLAKDKSGMVRGFVKGIKSQMKVLGLEINDVMSLMITESD